MKAHTEQRHLGTALKPDSISVLGRAELRVETVSSLRALPARCSQETPDLDPGKVNFHIKTQFNSHLELEFP